MNAPTRRASSRPCIGSHPRQVLQLRDRLLPSSHAMMARLKPSVSVGTTLVGAAIDARIGAPHSRWFQDFGVGGSATLFRFVGHGAGSVGNTTVPNVGQVVTSWKTGVHARAGAGLRLAWWALLRADALTGVVAGKTVIANAVVNTSGQLDPQLSRDLATWGPWFWGASLALLEKASMKDGGIEQRNFDSYTPMRMSQIPEIDVSIISNGEPAVGCGEPAVTVIAPAIGNAVFNAVGAGVRSLPITAEAVKAAMKT